MAERSSWVPLPCCSLPERPFSTQSLSLSVAIVYLDNSCPSVAHSQALKGSLSCNKFRWKCLTCVTPTCTSWGGGLGAPVCGQPAPSCWGAAIISPKMTPLWLCQHNFLTIVLAKTNSTLQTTISFSRKCCISHFSLAWSSLTIEWVKFNNAVPTSAFSNRDVGSSY